MCTPRRKISLEKLINGGGCWIYERFQATDDRCSFAASLSLWEAKVGRSQVQGLFVGPDYENVSGQSRQLNKTPPQNKNWKEGWAYSGPEFV